MSDICLCGKCNCSTKEKCNDYSCKCCILDCIHLELHALVPGLNHLTDEQLESIIERSGEDEEYGN